MTNPSTPALPDAAARDRITEDTASTLFVEAGAGSGKTRSLVDRVTTLVLRDQVPLSRIAAVTFTEKAGAELRDRLRSAFERRWRQARREAGEHAPATEAAARALDDLDSAAIGTLHAFAQRILSLHPIEAGLPPQVQVLDEVASSVAFDERWSVLQRELLDDPELSEPLLLALTAGVKTDDLRSLARAFGANWDLITERVLPGGPPAVTLPDPAELIAGAERLAARADECSDPADLFLDKLAALRDWASLARAARDPAEQHAALLGAAELKWSYGRKGNWPDLADLKLECTDWQHQAAALAGAFAEATLRPLAYWIAERVLRDADDRAAEGRLEFHDLLVLARRLLTAPDATGAAVRAALQRRFQVLLLDEFQDTDPIQIELAVRIAGGADATAPDWRDVRVPPGSLFVVGDPKQSIYRFRRANIATYLQAQQHLGEPVALTSNFRSVAAVLGWVNDVFGRLIRPEPDAQPAYQALAPQRPSGGTGPAVTLLGVDEHPDKPDATELRHREAADVAAVILHALAQPWTVQDRDTREWRALTAADIAILVPSRTSLPFLQAALDDAGVGYRAESSSLVYTEQEVRDLMAAARVLADPTDLLSCVTALRSPLFGCGDDDLWAWRCGGGSFSIQAPVPDSLAGTPVGLAMDYLQRLQRRARWLTPSEVLGALVEDRRMLEVATATVGVAAARDSWRRLRFVVDQARAWSETERGGLRGYLAWAARQADETSRVAEAILPETDVDAVRIMTIHGAKGLEFPMVVLSGMSAQAQNRRGVQVLWPAGGGFAIRLTKYLQTNDFAAVQPVDEQMDALERRRLLYVAATRARDHLVVSLHRKPVGKGATTRTNAQLLAEAGASDAPGGIAWAGDDAAPGVGARVPAVTAPPDWDAWLAGVTASRHASQRHAAQSASGLEGTDPVVVYGPADGAFVRTPAGTAESGDGGDAARFALPDEVTAGAAKGVRDLELPPWTKGRYGTAIGRAVHAVLQTADLAAGAPADNTPAAAALTGSVAAQCLAEGVVEFAGTVTDLARSALASPVVAHAAARPHWRETWVATTLADGTVLEGIVDLLYRDDDGTLVIVDYKTDAVPAAALPSRAAYYRPQIQAYARALRAATGQSVTGTLLFLHPAGAAAAVPVDGSH